MNSAWYIFKTHARDFESYLKFLGSLENKICTLVETGIFIFQIISRTTKNVENRGHTFLISTKFYLSTKNEIHSMMSRYLKLVKSLMRSHKRLGFSIKINVSVKKCDFEFFLLLLSYRTGIKL